MLGRFVLRDLNLVRAPRLGNVSHVLLDGLSCAGAAHDEEVGAVDEEFHLTIPRFHDLSYVSAEPSVLTKKLLPFRASARGGTDNRRPEGSKKADTSFTSDSETHSVDLLALVMASEACEGNFLGA